MLILSLIHIIPVKLLEDQANMSPFKDEVYFAYFSSIMK